jgi:hypothetical protein
MTTFQAAAHPAAHSSTAQAGVPSSPAPVPTAPNANAAAAGAVALQIPCKSTAHLRNGCSGPGPGHAMS